MNLYDAIASETEFAPWIDGSDLPVTVLIAPDGLDVTAFARDVRDALLERGVLVRLVDVEDVSRGKVDASGAKVIVAGPLVEATAEAMAFPGSVVIVPHGDVADVSKTLERASLQAQASRGLTKPGQNPDIQHACNRVQIVAPLGHGTDAPEILPGGRFFAHGLDLSPVVYAPGNPWRPVGAKPGELASQWSEASGSPESEDDPMEPLDIDLEDMAARISGTLMSTYLPTWREGTPDDDRMLDGTDPMAFLPDGTAWPEEDGHPLASILHLDIAGLPDPVRDLLGGSGLLQLFLLMDEGFPSGSGDGGWVARIVDVTEPGVWQEIPKAVVEPPIPRRVITGWREVREFSYGNEDRTGGMPYPDLDMEESDEGCAIESLRSTTFDEDRLPSEGVAKASRRHALDPLKAEAVAELLTHYRRDKLLGWPSWEQAAAWPDEGGPGGMVLLFQFCFDSEDAIAPSLLAGDGALQLLVSTDGERRFALRWACG